jgi:hypothetical protein
MVPRKKNHARIAGTFAGLAVGLGLAACSSLSSMSIKPVAPIPVSSGRAATLISAYRAQNGRKPVTVNAWLMSAASDYARAMAERDKINHRIGGSLPRRIGTAGYQWGAAAENLAAGFDSLDAAMAGWKVSSGHRANLLNPLVTEIGVAAYTAPPGSKRRNYWALILAAPPPERVAADPFGMELVR